MKFPAFIALVFLSGFGYLQAAPPDSYFPLREGLERRLKDSLGFETLRLSRAGGLDSAPRFRLDRIGFSETYQSDFLFENQDGIFIYGRKAYGDSLVFARPYLFLKNTLLPGDSWNDTVFTGSQKIALHYEVHKPEIIRLEDTAIEAIKVTQETRGFEYERYFAKNIGLVKEAVFLITDGKRVETNSRIALLKKEIPKPAITVRKIPVLTNLIKKDPGDFSLYRERALAHHASGKLNAAVKDLKAYILMVDDSLHNVETLEEMHALIKIAHESRKLYREWVQNPQFVIPTELVIPARKDRDYAFDSMVVAAIIKLNPVQDTISVEDRAGRRGDRIVRLCLPAGSVILPVYASYLDSLEFLDMTDTYINAFPDDFAKLSKLHEIILFNATLKGLDSFPAGMWNIRSLDTVRCVLVPVAERNFKGISRCNRLKFIMCNETRLEAIPDEIYLLQNLTLLELDGTIKTVSPSIGNLVNLTGLVLGNRLEHLPVEIGKLKKLEALVLKSNRLKTLPPEIKNFSRLTYLNLSNNQLDTLPLEITKLNVLTNLEIDNNSLCALPASLDKWLCKKIGKAWKQSQQCQTIPVIEKRHD